MWVRIDKLKLAIADVGSQSERAWEKLAYFAGVMTEDGDLDSYIQVEQELKLTALKQDEANELVKNVCAILKGVVVSANMSKSWVIHISSAIYGLGCNEEGLDCVGIGVNRVATRVDEEWLDARHVGEESGRQVVECTRS